MRAALQCLCQQMFRPHQHGKFLLIRNRREHFFDVSDLPRAIFQPPDIRHLRSSRNVDVFGIPQRLREEQLVERSATAESDLALQLGGIEQVT